MHNANRDTAAALISRHLADCLPPGTPPSYRSIDSARFSGSGRNRKATGELTMFDGQTAAVEVFPNGHGFGHRWSSMSGGDLALENRSWKRVAADNQLVFNI